MKKNVNHDFDVKNNDMIRLDCSGMQFMMDGRTVTQDFFVKYIHLG